MPTPVYSDLSQSQDTPDFLSVDIEAIRQAIANILNTDPGERFFNPKFGSGFRRLLFDPMDEETAKRIEMSILFAVSELDSRVNVSWQDSYVNPLYTENKYEVVVWCRVVGLEEVRFDYRGYLVRA